MKTLDIFSNRCEDEEEQQLYEFCTFSKLVGRVLKMNELANLFNPISVGKLSLPNRL